MPAPGSAARGRRDAAGAPSAPIDAASLRRTTAASLESAASPVGRAVSGKASRTAAWYADAVLAAGTFRTAQRASWRNNQIVTMASDVVQRYMKLWLTHSRSMRLSSVEEMSEASVWKHVRTFIEAYGADLFHAKLLTLG
jgi:hypothetical protein